MASLRKRLARARRRLLGLPPPCNCKGRADRYFYLAPDLAMVRLNCGHMLYVDPLDEHVSANIIATGNWEIHIHRALLALIRPGFRIVEVGANVGYYTITMAGAAGPGGFVTALEGNPRLAGLVQRSVLLNGYSSRTRIISKAALDQPAHIDFVVSRRNSGGGFVTLWEGNPYEDGETLTVEAVRIDDQDVGRVDLIRIDAEGSEPFILRGAEATLRANPDIIICLEWSVVQMGSRTPVADFITWMGDMGFQFWRIGPNSSLSPTPLDSLASLDNCDLVAARRLPKDA